MDKNLSEKLRLLAQAYSQSLPSKIATIETLWHELQQKWDLKQYDELYHMIHNIHGSARIYGYPSLSNAAEQFELQLKKFAQHKPTKEMWDLTQENYEGLIQAAGEPQQDILSKPQPVSGTSDNPQKSIYLFEKNDNLSQQIALQLNSFGYYTQVFDNTNKLPPVNQCLALIIDSDLLNESVETFLKEIINQFAPAKAPIYVISRNDDIKQHLRALRAGAQGYFILPFQVEEITQKINEQNEVNQQASRVLIVEDNVDIANYYREILQQNYMLVQTVNEPLRVDEVLHEFKPDLILMDIYMPECNGLELATIIRQRSAFEEIPIIFLSSESDTSKQLEALSLGADDFIHKSTKPEFLLLAIKNRIRRYKALRNLITLDSLTGVLNHTNIQQRLMTEMTLAQRHQVPLSVALIDLDHFKQINETHGYPIGDQMLKKLSVFLKNRLRKSDIIGRTGGEEFLIILPNTQAEAAQLLINELREKFIALNSLIDYKLTNNKLTVTFSAGIASFPPIETVQGLIEKSDAALQSAKQLGRNQVFLETDQDVLSKQQKN